MAKNQETLRVAFYPLDGFFEYDGQGNEIGYGVELLNRITRYTGIKFTYVKADSWEDTKSMLLNGQADIRMPGTLPNVTSTTLGYTQHSIMDTYYAVMTLKIRTELAYDDFDTFKNLKIGISSSLYKMEPVKDNLSGLNISEKNLLFFDSYNDCRAALQAGKIDALISNVMDLDDGMKLISRFSYRSNYISMTVGNPYLNVLNEAIYKITMEDPTFFSDLYRKWFPERANIPFTKQENAYIAANDHLSFYIGDGQGYLSNKEKNGEHTGFYPALAQSICSDLGLSYEEFDKQSQASSGTVIVPDFYYDYSWADEMNAAITEPYTTASYYKIALKGKNTDGAKEKVAAVKDFRVTRDYIQTQYDSDQMVWCNDYADCLEAVYKGKADITYINRYTAEYYLNYYRYSGLSATLTDYSHQVCFAVMGDDKEIVASIINKRLSTISQDELNAIMIKETSVKPEQKLFFEWFYQNPIRSSIIIAAVGIAVVLLLGSILYVQKSKRKNTALIKATHVKQEFLSRMSHDMRTPMNAIISFSGFGVNSTTLEQAHCYHQKIRDASEYLLQLINDSLDLSKLEAGTFKLYPEPYRNVDFIENISNILQPKADEKGVIFTIDNKLANAETAVFDKLRLQQIFINLINNAIKFTPAGGHVTFVIDAVPGKNQDFTATFSVIDDGIGMSEEFKNTKLYKPFVQERRLENAENGTGLGLSIVKELVTAMGGTISCKSAPGKGTTFTVVLKTKTADFIEASQGVSGQQNKNLRGRNVLLCEDHPLNREIATKLLQNAEAQVTTAENGQLGLDIFKKSEIGYFDAILMDIRMPVMGGLETAREIRALERPDAATIPIVAMTANAFDEDVQESADAGMNAHLAKPIEPQKLYDCLEDLINNRR